MLLKLSKIMGLSAGSPGFDPTGLKDALALRVDWSPLKRGGASFRTRKLVNTDLQRCEFRPTAGALLFSLVFAVMGLTVPSVIVFSSLRQEDAGLASAPLFPLLIGAVFVWIGGYMFRAFTTPVVFDLRNGYFWKGRKTPMEIINHADIKCAAKLEEIHALQLVSERCTSKNSSYLSYELNLVLESGERLNIFDHGNVIRAREDAEQLGRFLGRPVWDAIRQ
jgi:hypothetical protein